MNELEQLREFLDISTGKRGLNQARMLLEYDTGVSDTELRNDIIGQLKTEDDRDMLDKIYTVLNQSGLDERIAKILSADEDTKGKLDIFAGLIMHTPGTFKERNQFIEDFPGGFIDTSKLMTKNNIQSMDSWLEGGDFVRRVYDSLYRYEAMGIGKGEYALAVLSPDIKFAGRSSTDHGDLNISGTSVEVKAQVGAAGGRFNDARKAKMNQTGIMQALEQAGVPYDDVASKTGISDVSWVKNVRPMIEKPADVKRIAQEVVKGLFTHVSANDGKDLVTALVSGDLAQIRLEWGILGYTNYQKMSDFASMLMLSLKDNSSLFFTNPKEISTKIKPKGAFLAGAEQTIHPQIVIDMSGAGGDFGDGDSEPFDTGAPVKTKRKSKADIKADNRADDLAKKRADFKSDNGSRSPIDKALYGRDKADNWFNDRYK